MPVMGDDAEPDGAAERLVSVVGRDVVPMDQRRTLPWCRRRAARGRRWHLRPVGALPFGQRAGTGPGSMSSGGRSGRAPAGREEQWPRAPRRESCRPPASSRRACSITVADPVPERRDIRGREPGRLHRLEHPHVARRAAEAPVVLGERGAGTVHGERQDRHAGVDGQAERAVLERQQVGAWWTACPRGRSSPTPGAPAPRGTWRWPRRRWGRSRA